MRKGEVTLASGRRIELVSLHQSAVYHGLLECLPTRRMNDAEVERVRKEARDRTGHEPFLIEPPQSPIEIGRPYPFGEPAMLPPIVCVGDFISDGDEDLEHTLLTVIWFQDDYAFPLSPEAASSIAAINWDKVARRELL